MTLHQHCGQYTFPVRCTRCCLRIHNLFCCSWYLTLFKNSLKTSRFLEARSASFFHSIKRGGLNFNFFFFCLPNFELLLALSLSASLPHPSLPHLHLFSFLPSTLAIALWVPTRSYHRDQRCHGNCGLQQWQRRRQQQNSSLAHMRAHTHTHALMDDTD